MKEKVDSLIQRLTLSLLHVAWPQYMKHGNEHRPSRVLYYWFVQKIARVNSHVPWPVHPTTFVSAPSKIIRGSRTPGLSRGCHIDGRNGIQFGKNVWVGPRVSIISMNHDLHDFTTYQFAESITIGDNSWLGTGSIILPGVRLGEHTIVAAGAVVTHSFPEPNQILAGVPAKRVRKIDEYSMK